MASFPEFSRTSKVTFPSNVSNPTTESFSVLAMVCTNVRNGISLAIICTASTGMIPKSTIINVYAIPHRYIG